MTHVRLNRAFRRFAPLVAVAGFLIAPASSQAQTVEVCTRLQAQLAAYNERHPAVSPKLRRYSRAVDRHRLLVEQAHADIDAGRCTSGSVTVYGRSDDPACEEMKVKLVELEAELKLLEERRDRATGRAADIGRERLMSALRANQCALPGEIVIRDTLAIDEEAHVFDLDDDRARYRTMCVRSCDGYYFPISFSSSPASFPADAQRCAKQCPGADVGLYFYSVTAQESEDMLSADTQEPYLDHRNAFLYRTRSVPSCSCDAAGTMRTSMSEPAGGSILTPQQSAPGDPAQGDGSAAAVTGDRNQDVEFHAMDPGKRVRVVGPSFLPDRSRGADRQAPDRTDDP